MPAVPERLKVIAQIGNVAPHAYGSDSLLPRQPVIDIAAIAQDAPHVALIAKRQQMPVQQGMILAFKYQKMAMP